jgi:hypothetical protein
VAIAIAIIALVLVASGMSYQRYFAGAQFVHFLLGPATVALAVPLARQVPRLRRNLAAAGGALLCGCVTAIVSAVGVCVLLGGVAGTGALDRAEIGHHADRDGGVGTVGRRAGADRGAGDRHRHRRRRDRRFLFNRCASSRTRRAAWRWAWPRTASARRAPSRSVPRWARMPAWAWAERRADGAAGAMAGAAAAALDGIKVARDRARTRCGQGRRGRAARGAQRLAPLAKRLRPPFS